MFGLPSVSYNHSMYTEFQLKSFKLAELRAKAKEVSFKCPNPEKIILLAYKLRTGEDQGYL